MARVVIDLEGRPTYGIRSDGNTLIITFDSIHLKSSAPDSTSKATELTSPAINRQIERAPSLSVQDSSQLARFSEAKQSAPTSPDVSPTNRPALTQTAQGPSTNMSADTAALREPSPEPNRPVEKADTTSAGEDYVIGVQDVLAINVWREPELSRSVPVRPDGKISLPLVGDIMVSGLTPHALETRLTQELDSYLRKPQVTVIVQEVNSRKFSIIGQVEKPGTYPLATHVAILDALAMAGGFRDFAKVQKIYLLRLMPDGTRKRVLFDYKAAVNGKETYRDIEIQTGDTLVVP